MYCGCRDLVVCYIMWVDFTDYVYQKRGVLCTLFITHSIDKIENVDKNVKIVKIGYTMKENGAV